VADKKPRRGPKPKKKSKREVPGAAKTAAQPRKKPRVEESVDLYELKPTWSFAYLDIWWGETSESGCGWIHLSPNDLQELLDRLRAWETMKWGEILLADGSPNHPVPIENLFKSARSRLRALKLEDRDELVSLRVNAKARIFGILDAGVFKILWWDQNHQICPWQLKHT
jgi:hypothetical protein